jgi:hypothetical protein
MEASRSNSMDSMKYLSLFVLIACAAVSNVRAELESSLLKELHGVGLAVSPFIVQSKIFELDKDLLKQHASEVLGELEVSVLTDTEFKVLPGEPFLALSVNIAQAQGPSHIYSISLSLRERAQLERPKESIVSMAVSTWERETIGVANRPEGVIQAIDRLLRVFAEEYHRATAEQ